MQQIRRFDEAAFRLASIIVLFAVLSFGYSLFEGRINPVMGQMTISNARMAQPYRVTFDGEAENLRVKCDWIESRWYIGQRDGLAVATVWDYAGAPRVRSVAGARSVALTWIDQNALMTRHDLTTNSYADAVHQCPWQPWKTVTPFWTSPSGE